MPNSLNMHKTRKTVCSYFIIIFAPHQTSFADEKIIDLANPIPAAIAAQNCEQEPQVELSDEELTRFLAIAKKSPHAFRQVLEGLDAISV